MSVAISKNPNKRHEILDDFESIFWGLFHNSLHYFEHKKGSLPLDMKMFDEQEYRPIDGLWHLCGGTKKREALLNGISNLVQFDSPALTKLLKDLAAQFHNYYSLTENVLRLNGETVDPHTPKARGKARAFRDEPIQRTEVPKLVTQEDPKEAQRKLDECRKKLSEAEFWISIFDAALAEEDEWLDDACGFDRYPSMTQKQEAKDIAKDRLSAMHTGSQLAAEAVAAARLHKENTDSDDDDQELRSISQVLNTSLLQWSDQ